MTRQNCSSREYDVSREKNRQLAKKSRPHLEVKRLMSKLCMCACPDSNTDCYVCFL